jgi:hypothetical protein
MWALGAAFVVTLWRAQAVVGAPAKRLCVSETRCKTLLAHLLFLLLALGAAWFGLAAHRRRHRVSATLGAVIAGCVVVAWMTPSDWVVHNVLANAPLLLLVLYSPIILAYGRRPLAAVSVSAVVLVWNGSPRSHLRRPGRVFRAFLAAFFFSPGWPATRPGPPSPWDGRPLA